MILAAIGKTKTTTKAKNPAITTAKNENKNASINFIIFIDYSNSSRQYPIELV